MTERIEARTPNSKLTELGGRKFRRSISLGAPMHYVDGEGKLQDIDLSSRMDRGQFLVDKAPYALRVDPTVPAYRYTSGTKGAVEVELIDPAASIPAAQLDGGFVWADIAKDTDYKIVPRKWGVAALTVLKSSDAPRQWLWRIEGEAGLLKPVSGTDAKGQICEIEQETKDGVLTARWTGRVTSRRLLRDGERWDGHPVYPVTIDPTVNEAIAANADDAWSFGAASFLQTGGNTIPAGFGSSFPFIPAVRFQTIGIPVGSTIDAATMTFDVISVTGSPSLKLYGDDVDDAAAWGAGSRPKNITKTTATVTLAPGGTGNYAATVTTIIAEIVARAGWASGNDMRFAAFDQVGVASNYFGFAALEHATRAATQLDIDYTAAGGAGQPTWKRWGGVGTLGGPRTAQHAKVWREALSYG